MSDKVLINYAGTLWTRCSRWEDIVTIGEGCSDTDRESCFKRQECSDSLDREHKNRYEAFCLCHKYKMEVTVIKLETEEVQK